MYKAILRIHTHCQLAKKNPPHEPKLVKEYGCPNAVKDANKI